MAEIIGYRRVSTGSQNLARQELPGCHRIFEEEVSGKSRKRPQLEELMRHARDGDTVQVHSIDRLARSLLDLQEIVDELVAKGVVVKFLKEGLEFSRHKDNATGRLMLQMLGSIAEFERTLIRSRQLEGIEKAKMEGKYKGRKPSIEPWKIVNRWEIDRSLSLREVAKREGCSVSSVYRILSLHEPYQTFADKNPTPKERADLKLGAAPARGYRK
ncbi:recombinase family protein [Sulfitobacter sp. HGT1]|uniref:recombinase family protein n=1 Tax=Sulfitobacter sp. HGT1 TaxID=2735435 RepID=UPI001593F939|nr:recombinase family protein [Sulfitobacter sp. HGT1]